jgi:hypothetical protein
VRKGQPFVVEAESAQQGGVQIGDANDVLDGLVAGRFILTCLFSQRPAVTTRSAHTDF